MVINNLYISCALVRPYEADAVLTVNPDAMLTSPVSGQGLHPTWLVISPGTTGTNVH